MSVGIFQKNVILVPIIRYSENNSIMTYFSSENEVEAAVGCSLDEMARTTT